MDILKGKVVRSTGVAEPTLFAAHALFTLLLSFQVWRSTYHYFASGKIMIQPWPVKRFWVNFSFKRNQYDGQQDKNNQTVCLWAPCDSIANVCHSFGAKRSFIIISKTLCLPEGNGENNWIVGATTDGTGRTTVLERTGNDSLVLTLALASVSPEDSGQYLCSPSNMAPASCSLHVVIGNFHLWNFMLCIFLNLSTS